VFAVLKNGLWDDPASAASAGWPFDSLQDEVRSKGLHEAVAPYLCWRLCLMMMGLVFWVAKCALSFPSNSRADYEVFLEQLPANDITVDKAHFSALLDGLQGLDLAVWTIDTLSMLCFVGAAFAARPGGALERFPFSRKLSYLSWLLCFIPLFMVFLCFPLRSLVPWDALSEDVCVTTITATLKIPGSSLQGLLRWGDTLALLPSDFVGITKDQSAIRDFCRAQGLDWVNTFFGPRHSRLQVGKRASPEGVVQCLWEMEDRCKSQVCSKEPTAAVMGCLGNCLQVLRQKNPQAGKQFETAFTGCLSGARRQGYLPQRPGEIRGDTGEIGGLLRRQMQVSELILYSERMAETERLATRNLGEIATEITQQQEYVVGLLLGIVAARSLLPLCTSLLSAVVESIMNLKATFPSSAIAGYLLIFITAVSVPVFVSSFAFLIQTMGDPLLTAATFCVATYLSLSMITGYRVIHMNRDDLEQVYNVFWMEYGLRAVVGGAALALFLAWTFADSDRDSVRSYVMGELLNVTMVVGLIMGFLRGKAASTVAGTDILMSSVGDAILWTEENDQAGYRECITVLQSMRSMGDPTHKPQAAVTAPGVMQIMQVSIQGTTQTDGAASNGPASNGPTSYGPASNGPEASQWYPQQTPAGWQCASCRFDNQAGAAQCKRCGSVRQLSTPRMC